MKKVAIIGTNSYIGQSFYNYCKNDFQIETINAKDDEWKQADLSKYDAIFHVAGIAHIKETKDNAYLYNKINCDLAVEVANMAKEKGVKQFIYLSSMSVYGLERGHITDQTQCKPNNNYGKSKLSAEQSLTKLETEKFKIARLRPPMVYGKGCKGNFPRLLSLSDKLNFFPNIKNERSMIYVTNLCEFVKLIINNISSGVFYPQNSEYVSTVEIIRQYKLKCNKKCRLTKFFNPAIKVFGFMRSVKKVFGSLTYDKSLSNTFNNIYNLTDFETSIKECLEYI